MAQGETPTQLSPHGGPRPWERQGEMEFKGHLPSPSDTAFEPMSVRCHGQVPLSKHNDCGATLPHGRKT